MDRAARTLLLVAGAAAAAYALGLFDPLVYRPTVVRGDDRARPLETAIADFDREDLISVLPRDGIPAIDDPEVVAADRAQLRDTDRVIGVQIESRYRAYAIRVLSAHEVVNDEAAGIPFAVTW